MVSSFDQFSVSFAKLGFFFFFPLFSLFQPQTNNAGKKPKNHAFSGENQIKSQHSPTTFNGNLQRISATFSKPMQHEQNAICRCHEEVCIARQNRKKFQAQSTANHDLGLVSHFQRDHLDTVETICDLIEHSAEGRRHPQSKRKWPVEQACQPWRQLWPSRLHCQMPVPKSSDSRHMIAQMTLLLLSLSRA